MASESGVFNQVNLVVRDMEASLGFYRRLGVEVEVGREWPPGSGCLHAEVGMPGGATLEWDNVEFARAWAPQWRNPGAAVLGFSFETSAGVDARYDELTSAGYRGLQEPMDAFWGARYAVVADPDGNAVGLMGPLNDRPRYTPTVPPKS